MRLSGTGRHQSWRYAPIEDRCQHAKSRSNSLYIAPALGEGAPDEEPLFIGGLGTVRISPSGGCCPDLRNHLLRQGQMKFRMSLFVDAFLGSGVPIAGDPITSFQIVPLLGLRTGTVLDNCKPMAQDVVKLRFIATNCGERRLEIVRSIQDDRERDDEYSANNSISHGKSRCRNHTSF